MYLLDTNHCIHLINGDTELLQRLEKVADEDAGVATSIIVSGELEFGAANSERRNENTRKVSSFLDDIDVVSIDRNKSHRCRCFPFDPIRPNSRPIPMPWLS